KARGNATTYLLSNRSLLKEDRNEGHCACYVADGSARGLCHFAPGLRSLRRRILRWTRVLPRGRSLPRGRLLPRWRVSGIWLRGSGLVTNRLPARKLPRLVDSSKLESPQR